ncbi:protein CLEC16A homolog isoform X2 [Cimex lectularius]|uniref:Protein CLEC16A homolog n=1 Tax=Cimex lectularius TaxID=79782 RepID=A0A8I6RJ02_CIMLE|nr:protein CLEC16A homolog isoform X2 [Cimex lectularius]
MFRSRSWFGGSLWKNKNPHSLDHLKYLHNVLSKNQTVSENNRGLLVETLRSIAEILIWGDQNDSSVFDFFLEKNMLSFFLKILKQKCGSYVCVQLLQTLNILFENIRNETSLYYLLSNNHVNSIIVHKFDFSDEEVMAYYISFLKTLSLKLNSHTIHFFYNDHTNDFPLYTEAIKFFKHSESMVRIAVRTLTLNVYRVRDNSMLRFIRDKTAAPYFSNLVWFIGNHVIELDTCVRNDADHSSQSRLADLVAEHLDHLHYLNDILCLNIDELNDVLVNHLLNELYIPLYIFSLLPVQNEENENQPRVSTVVSLFLLTQVFIITKQQALVNELAQVIIKSTKGSWENGSYITQARPIFSQPTQSLEESLNGSAAPDGNAGILGHPVNDLNITDEEKEQRLAQESQKLFFEVIIKSLDCTENDYSALFSLCLLYAISQNSGIENVLLDGLLLPVSVPDKQKYNMSLVQNLIDIISLSSQAGSKVRLVTLELAILLLLRLVMKDKVSLLTDAHLAAVIEAKEESVSLLRTCYKREDIMFGEMFENEDEEMRKKPLNVEWLMMDSNILLPPTGTPMTGIEFAKRLPCGEVERARRAIRVFLLIRSLCLTLSGEEETQLPLTNRSELVQNDSVLDLNNSDLLSCHVIGADGIRNHRFLVITNNQIILVVPVPGHIGFGRPKLAAMLHDLDFSGDKLDSRTLYLSSKYTTVGPMVNTKFIFDDSIRCLAAQQRLTKGKMKVREEKLHQMEKVLDITIHDSPQQNNLLQQLRHQHRTHFGRPLLTRVPGYTIPIKIPMASPKIAQDELSEASNSPGSRSRDSSPKMPRPRSEEIQLERMHSKRGSLASVSSTVAEETSSCDCTIESTSEFSGPSKETSFTEPSADASRKKGKVETV